MIGNYRKKPVVIQAMQFDGSNHSDVIRFVGETAQIRGRTRELFIYTLEGVHRADPGDYIIRGVAGEFYPCKPAIFEATYEPVEVAA